MRPSWMVCAALLAAGCGGDKDGDTGAETDTDADTDTDSDTDTDTDTDSDTDTDTDVDTDTDTDTVITGGPFTLHFFGTNYDNGVGETCFLALKDSTDGAAPAIRGESVVSKAGAIDVTFEDALVAGHDYGIAWYFDSNATGACDEGDAVWMAPVGASVAADLEVRENGSGNYDPQGCQIINGP